MTNPRTGFCLLLSLLALVAAGKVILADTLDPDAFWHMRVGAEIARQTWPHPLIDDLSFSSKRTPWTPYSWLAEVAMKRLWDLGGFRAAIAVQAAMEAAFILLLGLAAVELSHRVHGNPRYFASAVGAAFGGLLSLAYLSFRPVTAALVLLALIACLLLRDRRLNQNSKAVWLIPLITVILINIHFFALFAPLWIAALLLGDFLQGRRISMRGILLFLATFAACACTPLLAGTLHSVFDYSTTDIIVRSGNIAEFRPFYLGIMGNIAAVFVALTLICVLWNLSHSLRFPLGEALWLVGSTILLFRMGRLAPLFAIIAVPAFAATIPLLSDRILSRPPVVAALAVVLALIFWPIARAFPRSSEPLSAWLNRNGADAPNFPCHAADYVEQNIPARTGHLLCDFTWGGFLEWRLAGRFQTLMDGRTQLFSPDFWTNAALGPPAQRKQFLASIPADAAIVRAGPCKLRTDLTALDWRIVFSDDFAEVWVPPLRKIEIRNSNGQSMTKSE